MGGGWSAVRGKLYIQDEEKEGACREGEDVAPKILANRASLYTHIAMLTIVVEMNFAGPGVTVE